MKIKFSLVLWLATIGCATWYFLHNYQAHRKGNVEPKADETMGEIWNRRDSTLAHQYNCPLLTDTLGTNKNLFTFQIQRFLNDNKRVAARGFLEDVYQSGDRLKAIFHLTFNTADEDTMYAVLECPTNLISILTSVSNDTYDSWALVVDVDNVDLEYDENSDEDASSSVYKLKRVEGKLVAVEPP
jgi:hypothetical protein